MDNCEYVNFYGDGDAVIDNNIANDNVYMAAVSADGANASLVYLRTPVAQGEVTGVTKDGKIVIDEKEYEIDQSILKTTTVPELGSTCEVYADEFGYVVYIKESKNAKGLRLAYLMDYMRNSTAFGDYTIKFKLLDQDNKIITAACNDSITVAGIKRKCADIAKDPTNIFPNVKAVGSDYDIGEQVIRYRTDDDGLIKEIDTAYETDKEKDNEGYTLTKYPDNVYENILPNIDKNRKQLRRFSQGGKIITRLDSNIIYTEDSSIMFNVPLTDSEGYLMNEKEYFRKEGTYITDQIYVYDDNGNKVKPDDSMYSVGNTSLLNIYSYIMDAYDYDKDMPYAECIVYHYPVAAKMQNLQIVTEFTQGLDADEVPTTFITLMSGSAEKSYSVESHLLSSKDSSGNITKINVGDVVISSFDEKTNKIYELIKVYDMKTDTIYPITTYNGYNAYENWAGGGYIAGYVRYMEARQMTRGRVLKRVGTVLYVDWNDDFVYDEILETNGAAIIVHDNKKSRDGKYFKLGTLADINDFETSGDDYSEILSIMDSGNLINILVYK